jgi:uncharacterized membrane protein
VDMIKIKQALFRDILVESMENALPQEELPHKKNIYPTLRHFILIMFVLLCVCILLLLILQNGRMVYEHGI